MTSDTKLVEVTQADRDAAAGYYFAMRPEIRRGAMDSGPLVQAFARHRIASTHPTSDNRSEMVERLFSAIAHGDEDHRAWLREAISAFYIGDPVPPPRGDGRKVARIAELERQVAALSPPSEIRRDALEEGARNFTASVYRHLGKGRVGHTPAWEEMTERFRNDLYPLVLRAIQAALIPTLEDGGGESG